MISQKLSALPYIADSKGLRLYISNAKSQKYAYRLNARCKTGIMHRAHDIALDYLHPLF